MVASLCANADECEAFGIRNAKDTLVVEVHGMGWVDRIKIKPEIIDNGYMIELNNKPIARRVVSFWMLRQCLKERLKFESVNGIDVYGDTDNKEHHVSNITAIDDSPIFVKKRARPGHVRGINCDIKIYNILRRFDPSGFQKRQHPENILVRPPHWDSKRS